MEPRRETIKEVTSNDIFQTISTPPLSDYSQLQPSGLSSAEGAGADQISIEYTPNGQLIGGAPSDKGGQKSNVAKQTYNPYDFGNANNPTSFMGTVFHVIILAAGTGILSIPSAFVSAGYAAGLIIVPALVWFYAYNIYLLVWSEYELCKMKKIPRMTYSEVAYHAFHESPLCGRWLAPCSRWLSQLVFIFVWFGYCCYNYVTMGRNLSVLFENTFEARISADIFLAALVLPLVLLGWVRKLKYLVPFSALGSVLNFVSLLVILYFVFADSTPGHSLPPFGPLSSVPLLMGSVMFSLNATGLMMSLKNEMRKPSKFTAPCGVLTVSFVPTSFIFAFFSLVCATKYGDSTRPSVIQNLPPANPVAQVGLILSFLALLFQYQVLLYVPYDVIRNQIFKEIFDFHRYTGLIECLLKTILVALTAAISLAVPNVFLFLSFSGTVGTSIDSLIFPALIHTFVTRKVCKNKLKFRLIFAKNLAIIVLAVVLVIVGCADCISQVKNYYKI